MELAACWSSAAWDKSILSDSNLCSMKKNVFALMVTDDPSIDPNMPAVSIDDLL